MKAHVVRMAGYNAWCNRRVYEAVARLSDAEYRADCGAFFKSVHGTLNHLIATDRIWLRRFTGEGEAPSRLDAILFETFATLAPAREAEDHRILSYANGLTEEDLGRRFRYRRVSEPDEIEEPLAPTLFHLFNHQTHHRGQVHGLLTHLGHEAPSLDLIQFVREQEQSPF